MKHLLGRRKKLSSFVPNGNLGALIYKALLLATLRCWEFYLLRSSFLFLNLCRILKFPEFWKCLCCHPDSHPESAPVGMFPAPGRPGAWLAHACSRPLSISCTPYHVQESQAGILCLDNLYTHHHLTHHLFILKIPQIQAFGLYCKLCVLSTSSTWTFFYVMRAIFHSS